MLPNVLQHINYQSWAKAFLGPMSPQILPLVSALDFPSSCIVSRMDEGEKRGSFWLFLSQVL